MVTRIYHLVQGSVGQDILCFGQDDVCFVLGTDYSVLGRDCFVQDKTGSDYFLVILLGDLEKKAVEDIEEVVGLENLADLGTEGVVEDNEEVVEGIEGVVEGTVEVVEDIEGVVEGIVEVVEEILLVLHQSCCC